MMREPIRAVIAIVLLAAAALFVAGSIIEHSKPAPKRTHTETGSEEGTEEPGSEGTGEAAESSERVFGLDLERPGFVAAAAALTVLLAGLALWWRDAKAFWIIIAFGLMFAALDVREALHQSDEGRTSVMAIAIVLAIIHAAAAALATIGARRLRTPV